MNARLIDPPARPRFSADDLPPHSVEAEMCTLCAMILAGNDPAGMAAIRATVGAGDFFQADHQILFRAIADVFDRCRTVDAMLLREELGRRKVLEEVGGLEYLAEIVRAAPNAQSGKHYANDVREKAVLRRLITGAHDVLRRAHGPLHGTRADELARDFLAELHGVAEGRCADAIVRIDAVIDRILSDYLDGTSKRIRTGLSELDQLCGGLPIGRFTVVAGRPGMGKSQLGKQIIRNLASGLPAWEIPAQPDPWGNDARPAITLPAQPPKVCGIVSVEETLDKIGQNYLAGVASVENNRLTYGTATSEDMRLVLDASVKISKLPIYLTDRPIRLDDVESVITTMVTRFECEVIFVDYLQLIHGPDAGNKEQEIARISTTLKNLGKTLGVTMLVAAQLSRANETGGVRKPELRDLRHSGQIEQDGDLILLLHRGDYYAHKEQNFVPNHLLEAIVAKNKDGPLGTAVLNFEGKYQTVTDRTVMQMQMTVK
jgi:replicative DNA helicase